ncbi:hypothetical protein FC093_23395 [Ilyomonas limi]|uniref:Uncharacterized protein n=1 Tax=Ilyomonas limi TaxID=2575867 RepID=A0A4U3KP84_9BACT|nr:hypothetical protein [Ilyomonas limi]TKK64045.1 hypothetical protein FC093_23395 [Ilyomonas limi]
MGRQINFFLHPDDQPSLDKLLKSFGKIILLPYYHHDNKISTVEDTIVRDVKKEGARIYLVRQEDFKEIKLEHISKFNYWLVADNKLPVLHFDRSIFKDNKIHSGRLYFQPQFADNMQWIKKSDTFINWADNIIKTVRRKLKKYKHKMGNYEYTGYLGDNALKWLKEHKAEVGAAGHELIPAKMF